MHAVMCHALYVAWYMLHVVCGMVHVIHHKWIGLIDLIDLIELVRDVGNNMSVATLYGKHCQARL